MSSSVEQDPMAQHFVECELCETRPAQHFCNTCPGALCEICKEEHRRKKMFQNHEIIPLASSRKQTISFCTDHKTKRSDLYCKQCNQPVCSECITEKHKGHIIEKLSSYLEDHKFKIMQYINRISEIEIPAHENLLTETKTSHAQVIKSAEKVNTLIQKQTENIIHAVKSAESDILAVLRKDKRHALISIESDQSIVSDRITRLNEIKKTLQEMHDSSSVDENLLKQQISKIEELQTFPEVTTATPFNFVPADVEMSQIKLQIGNLTSLSLSKIQKSRVNESSDSPRFVHSDKKLILKPKRKTKVKVDVEEKWEIRCMNTNTAVLRGNDNKIRIVDISGKVTTITTNIPKDFWPSGIDLTKDNDIIYTDKRKRRVMRFSLNGDLSTMFTLLTDYFPFGLFVTSTGSIMMSLVFKLNPFADGQRGKVVEYTTSGQIIKEFFKDGGRELFKIPQYVVKNHVNDDILVSDFVLDKVIVLNGMGNLKFEYNGKALSKSNKFWPKQITCDSLCQILIADEYSGAIHVISNDGHPLTLLLTGELSNLVCVCFDGIDSVWIAERMSQKIKIYKYLE